MEEVHHVFWTGGQDSTFRVLQLLETTSQVIQPHYMVRHEEHTGNEIDTMTTIRRQALKKYPEWRSRFLPTVYINVDLVPSFEEINEKIEDMRKSMRVHEQYKVLTSYCKAEGITKIDLSYLSERDDGMQKDSVRNYFGIRFPFESFRTPLLGMTKRECYTYSKDHGWDDLLNLSWFCRRPLKKMIPCGKCGPCKERMNNGMSFSLPLKSRHRTRGLTPYSHNPARESVFSGLKHKRGIALNNEEYNNPLSKSEPSLIKDAKISPVDETSNNFN